MKVFNNKTSKKNSGFSLIELLVVITIIVIISTVVLLEYSNFSSQSLLNITAQEIAVTIRQAQVFGISIYGESDDGVNYQFPNYGIYIEKTTGSPNQMIFFADLDGTDGYNAGSDAVVSIYRVPVHFNISKLCVDEDGFTGGELCSDNSGLTEVNILFKRPDPEPKINSNVLNDASVVQIFISDLSGERTRRIEVWNTGQISVYND